MLKQYHPEALEEKNITGELLLIVVTGSAGYIGSALTKKLTALGYDIDTWDIRQPMETPMENVKCVVHLAALVRVGESVKRPLDYYDTNVTGTLNVIRAFA